jgi:hypothetical protein
LPEEQAFCLANEESPAFLPGFFQIALASCKVEPQITEAFRTGKGMGWHEHDPDLFCIRMTHLGCRESPGLIRARVSPCQAT